MYTHPSESAAIKFILANPQQRTFVLVVLRKVTPAKV